MLTDPVKFYEYFQIAHSQLQGTGKEKASKKEKKQSEEEEKKEPKKITEFDDLSLFLLTIPGNLVSQGKDEKFEALIKQLNEGALNP